MSVKHRNLMEKITEIENLRKAYIKTSMAKRMTHGYLEFKEHAEANLVAIQEELKSGNYRIGPYKQFTVYEPKPRLISALSFRDRLVQHAMVNIIGPIFEAGLLPHTYACREGKGTHAGVAYIQSRLRKAGPTHFLKTDFSKYFPSIDRATLHRIIERKISCRATLALIKEIVPPEGEGIPIGSLTSQLFANVYAGQVDRFIHFDLKERNWARYMDDIIILGDDPSHLRAQFARIEAFAQSELKLTVSKWQVSPISRGINFLGYRIWPHHKLLRKDSVTRAKRKIKRYLKHGNTALLDEFIASWSGHALWADTHNLLTHLELDYGLHP